MTRFLSFTSGSCGNCYFLGTERSGILIDAGVSLRKMKKVLEAEGLDYEAVDAVLITHDHLDHIRHLGSYCNRLSRPVYTTPRLHAALAVHTFTAGRITACRRDLDPVGWTAVTDGIEVRPFEVPHDATQTLGYAVRLADGHRFVLMTDMGRMTDEALRYARSADTVVIESNFDIAMLLSGGYPYELKMRICQGSGHLGNDACADAVRAFYHPGLRNLFLCHLSQHNNTPQLALEAAAEALRDVGAAEGTVRLRVLPRQVPTPMILL